MTNPSAQHRPNETRQRTPRRQIGGIGRVLLWNGGSLWLGRDTGLSDLHSHHAIQIALAMDAPFRMTAGDGSGWRDHRGAIVMPHRPHRFDGCGQRTAMIFVEPETAHGRVLVERYGAVAIADLAADSAAALVAALRSGFLAAAPDDALAATARDVVAALVGSAAPEASVDARIGRAIAWARSRLDAPVSLAEAAAVAHLSPSRFRHLFVAQTGVSFRAYLLWARVEKAVGAAMRGQSWTTAAQDAGFADSAHLSRTCRRMFGFAPAALVLEQAPVRADDATAVTPQ